MYLLASRTSAGTMGTEIEDWSGFAISFGHFAGLTTSGCYSTIVITDGSTMVTFRSNRADEEGIRGRICGRIDNC